MSENFQTTSKFAKSIWFNKANTHCHRKLTVIGTHKSPGNIAVGVLTCFGFAKNK